MCAPSRRALIQTCGGICCRLRSRTNKPEAPAFRLPINVSPSNDVVAERIYGSVSSSMPKDLGVRNPEDRKQESRDSAVTAEVRSALLGQRGCVLWLTGLSGAGKSTLSIALERQLLNRGVLPVILDGDVLRTGLCHGLGFSESERKENIRRAAEAALLVAEAGAVVIVALISPFRADRDHAAERCRARGIRFAEVYVNAPLAECERRDPKHLYAKVRAGEIPMFTGISSPYEPPLSADLELHTDRESVDESVAKLTKLAFSLAQPNMRMRYVSNVLSVDDALRMEQARKDGRISVFRTTFRGILRALFTRAKN
jgi:adenylylsulfate kinase